MKTHLVISMVSLQLIAGAAFAADTGRYCGMRSYYQAATGEILHLPVADAATAAARSGTADSVSRSELDESGSPVATTERSLDEDKALAESAAMVSFAGTAVAIAVIIAKDVKNKHLWTVYENIREAHLLNRDPHSTEVSNLERTRHHIDGHHFRDPQTGKKVKVHVSSLGALAQAVVDAAKDGAYCGKGEKLLVTDKFRDAVVKRLIRPSASSASSSAARPEVSETPRKSVSAPVFAPAPVAASAARSTGGR